MKKILLLNRWRTPDGTVLTSYSTHDYVSHTDENGEQYFIDGGSSYIRMSVNDEKMEDMCVYYDSPFHEIRKCICRGTFDAKNKRIWVPLCNMSDAHLMNCITYNANLFNGIIGPNTAVYMREIIWRYESGISIPERTYTKRDVKPRGSLCGKTTALNNGTHNGDWKDGFRRLVEFDADKSPELVTSTYYVSILKKCVAAFENSNGETECDL